jgi:hypothetical protein
MAGADLSQIASLPAGERRTVGAIIDEGFVFAFRLVVIGAAALSLAAAGVGNQIRRDPDVR